MDSAQAVHACEGVQGANEITVDVPSFGASCVEEFWTAFYVYQIYAGLICFFWDFISVGLMMMLLVFASGLFKVVTERMQRLKLKRMASIDANVWAKRDGGWLKVHCRQLCVGDLLCVTSDGADPTKTVSADCVLVKGNCVVDESFLTGETMPIQKFEADGDAKPVLPTESGHKKYFIFSGTDLLDASGGGSDLPAGVERGALAVVTHTGGRSTRGSLLRGLLFATPLKLQFVSETKLVLVLLVIIAMVDFTIVNIKYSFSMSSIMTALFMVISVVNPLLSVAVLGGQVASARRLASDSGRNKRKRSIIKMPKMQGRGGEEDEGEGDVEMGSVGAKFGSHPSASDGGSEPQSKIFVRDVDRMALAGRVDLICFDKTGTITKSGLDFVGAVGVSQRRQPGSAGGDDGGKLKGLIGYDGRRPEGFDIPEELASALALTHTVSRLGDRKIGHQVELRMVEAAESLGWTYSQDMRTVSTWQIEEQWTFDHHTMTMSVLCTVPEREEAWVFCKGSFEAVSGLCTRCESPSSGDAESGQDWREVLEELAELSESLSTKGCYVLAVARKRVPFSTISKVFAEKNSHEKIRGSDHRPFSSTGCLLAVHCRSTSIDICPPQQPKTSSPVV
jgi:magnesium-transporting ATPase (P-type)